MELKGVTSELKDVDTVKGIATGYLAHFGSKDEAGDIIMPGAFTKTISERGPKGSKLIKHLLDHKKDQAVGVFTELKEDSTGLYYESKIGSHKLGKDFLEMCASGIINQHSIGFNRVRQQKKSDATYLHEIKLGEGSSLQFLACNPNTPFMGLKGEVDVLEYFQTLDGAIKNGTFSDETFKMLIEYSDSIKQSLIEKAPSIDTLSENAPMLINHITNAFKLN